MDPDVWQEVVAAFECCDSPYFATSTRCHLAIFQQLIEEEQDRESLGQQIRTIQTNKTKSISPYCLIRTLQPFILG